MEAAGIEPASTAGPEASVYERVLQINLGTHLPRRPASALRTTPESPASTESCCTGSKPVSMRPDSTATGPAVGGSQPS